jgi:UDP-2,3-diacylglucosamine pyrophosphatase LpxH
MSADFTFVHAADIHLDSPLSGLAARDPAFSALVRGATRKAFANVVDLAIAEGAAFVVIAGDLYDGTWKDQSTGQFAVAQFARLSRAGIRAFVVYGNHDAESRITRHLTMPEGVYAFDNRKCEYKTLDELGAVVHGRSYKQAATLENIAAEYTPPIPGRFNIALLHTALDGLSRHAPYAPCRLDELRASGHDYWALGHVHDAAVRSEFAHVVFPGNTQGRHVRETGAKGAMLVRVENGQVKSLEHRATDEVRWAVAQVDASRASDMRDLLDGVSAALRTSIADAGDRPTASRLLVQASGVLADRLVADPDWFAAEVIGQAAGVSDFLWIEKVKLVATAERAPAGLPPELAALLADAITDPDCIRAVQAAVAPLVAKLPADVGDEELAPLLAAARASDGAALLTAARSAVEARLERSEN